MAKFVLRDIKIAYGGRDLSGELSSLNMEFTAETPNATALSDITRRRLPGLLSVNSSHNGWWDSVDALDSLDEDLFSQVGTDPLLVSAAPNGGALGEPSFSWQALTAEYSPGAAVGEVFAFTFNTTGDGRLIRGTVLENSLFAATADGTPRQLGAALATDTIYSAFHVVAADGTTPTLDVVLESDDDVGFGSPVTRITHPQFTARGSSLLTLVGPVTDDWWRYTLTLGGTDPEFTVFGAVGILPTVPS